MRTLADVGELAFVESIARIAGTRAGRVCVGIGDDAAVVRTGAATVLTTDTQRENVHFRRAWLTPAQVGQLHRISERLVAGIEQDCSTNATPIDQAASA